MSTGPDGVNELLDWVGSGGRAMSPFAEIYRDPHTGLSIRAITDIPVDTIVLTCPYNKSLSYLNAISAFPGFPIAVPFPIRFLDGLRATEPHIIGHFFLIQQYLLAEKSYWWSYIRLLPHPQSVEIAILPTFWPSEDLKFLAGTNAEPAITQRRALWETRWRKGMSLLRDCEGDWGIYSYELYCWASAIFDSRAFRPSCTLSSNVQAIMGATDEYGDLLKTQILNDEFAVLWPLLDICNHNGTDPIEFQSAEPLLALNFRSRVFIAKKSQVWISYGKKSNSELLVGYGFTLSSDDHSDFDRAIIKLNPPPEVIERLQIHRCYMSSRLRAIGDQYIFEVKKAGATDSSEQRPAEIRCLEHALIEILSHIVATDRELRLLSSLRDLCISVETERKLWSGPLCRNVFAVFLIILGKLEHEIDRLKNCKFDSAPLQNTLNHNQKTALDYRYNCLSVLESARAPLRRLVCDVISSTKEDFTDLTVLSLERAWKWLRTHYLDIYNAAVGIIARDQEEPLPLDWAVLLEDWDHTLWIFWIMIIWMIHDRHCGTANFEDSKIHHWMQYMIDSYIKDRDSKSFQGETSECDVVDNMIEQLLIIMPSLGTSLLADGTLRNLASAIASDEMVVVDYPIIQGLQAGRNLRQRVLCLCTNFM